VAILVYQDIVGLDISEKTKRKEMKSIKLEIRKEKNCIFQFETEISVAVLARN